MYQKLGSSVRKTTKILSLSKRNRDQGKKIGKSTVQNYLKTTHWGKKAFKSPKKPLLSQKNIEDRKKFGDLLEKSVYLTSGIRGEKLRSNIYFQ